MATAQRVAGKGIPAKYDYNTIRDTIVAIRLVNDKEVSRTPVCGGLYDGPVRVESKLVTPETRQPDQIVLTLSVEEAETLLILGHQTGGDPAGRRGDTDRIAGAIRTTGVRYDSGLSYHPDMPKPAYFQSGRSRVGLPSSNLRAGAPPKQATEASSTGQNACGAATPTPKVSRGPETWEFR